MPRKRKSSNGAGKPTSDEVTRKHNVKSRNLILAEVGTQFRGIYTARKELNDQAGDLRTRLRDIGMIPKAFEDGLKRADMEQEAQAAYMDSFHEAYNALASGGQLDWVAAAETAAKAEPHEMADT